MSTIEAKLRERIAFLQEENILLRSTLQTSAKAWNPLGLTGMESAMFDLLMRVETASFDALHGALEVRLPNPDGRAKNYISVVACHARRKLRKHGIELLSAWGFGYRIPEEGKRRARNICGAQP